MEAEMVRGVEHVETHSKQSLVIPSNDDKSSTEKPELDQDETTNTIEKPERTLSEDTELLPGNMSDSSESVEENDMDPREEFLATVDRDRSGKFRRYLIATGMQTAMIGDTSDWDLEKWQEEVSTLLDLLPASIHIYPDDARFVDNKNIENLYDVIVNEIEETNGKQVSNFYRLGYLMMVTCSNENLQLDAGAFTQRWADVLACFNEIEEFFEEDFVKSVHEVSMEVACIESEMHDELRSSFSSLLYVLPERLNSSLAPNMSMYLVQNTQDSEELEEHSSLLKDPAGQ